MNEIETQVRDRLKAVLGARATLAKVEQDGDRVRVEVVSPGHFPSTAQQLAEAGPRIAEEFSVSVDILLSTTWPAGPREPQLKS